MGVLNAWWPWKWWPWKRSGQAPAGGVQRRPVELSEVVVVQRAQRGAPPAGDAAGEREAYILELQDELARLCRQPSPLMQRLHLFLSIVEAQLQARIHRGTLPLTNEEFDHLLRAIRAIDDAEQANEALSLRKSLVESGYITVPPRVAKTHRRA